jgi:hypothetical protein
LRLVGRDSDPARSREHVLLSVLAERRLRDGLPSRLEELLEDLAAPPIDKIGGKRSRHQGDLTIGTGVLGQQ